jgi:threonine dehydrogenase-like Zn-dependent dehydrogenase
MGANSREEESKRTIEQEPQGAQVETVVIVGAGLAGLATALALHRSVFFLNVQVFCNDDDSCLQIVKFIHNVHHIVTGKPDDFPVTDVAAMHFGFSNWQHKSQMYRSQQLDDLVQQLFDD